MNLAQIYRQTYGNSGLHAKLAGKKQAPANPKEDFVLGKAASIAFFDELKNLNKADALELQKKAAKDNPFIQKLRAL